MTSSANVKTLIPLMTPYTPTDTVFNSLWDTILAEFIRVAGAAGTIIEAAETQAEVYLYAYYLAGAAGQIGIKSEKIGSYSYSLTASEGKDRWYTLFEGVIERALIGRELTANEFSPGIDHYDLSLSKELNLDQTMIENTGKDDYEPEDT